MKYSLRSLMTFSIRDLLWLMVVAAILTAWWLDHRRWVPADLTEREAERLQIENKLLRSSIDRIDQQLPEHGLQLEEFRYRPIMGGPHYVELQVVPLPTSSAPAPIPPKE